jgi:hypothetical protein
MVQACRNPFERIISIELDDRLYRRACQRLASDPHIEIHHGDSGALLRRIIEDISEPCPFYYPTVGEVHDFVSSRNPDYEFEVDADIIRIAPPRPQGSGKGLTGW